MLCEDGNLVGLCENINAMKRNGILDHFALTLWLSFPSDGISQAVHIIEFNVGLL